MQAIFARGMAKSDRISDLPLYINNCGYYRDVDADVALERPKGREDYHLVFVLDGELDTDFGTLGAGECVFFQPHARQRYTYRKGKPSCYCWIHFSGHEAERIAWTQSVSGVIRYGENASQIHEYLFRIVRALREGEESAELYSEGLFRAILALLFAASRTSLPFGRALSMMKDVSRHDTVKDYAAACRMSEGHFIRSFREAYGCTPLEYRTSMQIDQAKNLLLGTSLKIGAVAALSGFSDALYFSRVFHAKTGMSPTEFRKQCT